GQQPRQFGRHVPPLVPHPGALAPIHRRQSTVRGRPGAPQARRNPDALVTPTTRRAGTTSRTHVACRRDARSNAMPDILHKIDVRSSPAATYAALTTLDGLSGWWTTTTQGNPEVSGTIAFRFGPLGGFDMKVLELQPARRVLWQVVDGPEEWIGTKVSFELKADGDFTAVLF